MGGMSAHAYADMPLRPTKYIYYKSRPDAFIIVHATLPSLNPSLKMHNYVAVHNLLYTMSECKCTTHIIAIVLKKTFSDITYYFCE